MNVLHKLFQDFFKLLIIGWWMISESKHLKFCIKNPNRKTKVFVYKFYVILLQNVKNTNNSLKKGTNFKFSAKVHNRKALITT